MDTDYQYTYFVEETQVYTEYVANNVVCTTYIGVSGKFIVCIREEEKKDYYLPIEPLPEFTW